MSNEPSAGSPEATEYQTALRQGRLLLRVCEACGETHHYPRPHCPFCLSDRTAWREASGRGVIYAFTVVRRGPGAGTAPAFVTLEEGPTIQATIAGCDLDDIGIDLPVRLVSAAEGGAPDPTFSPSQP